MKKILIIFIVIGTWLCVGCTVNKKHNFKLWRTVIIGLSLLNP